MSVLGLISIGQTLVILVGSLDLSVPYVVSLATVIAAGGMKGLDANIPAAVFNTLAAVRGGRPRDGRCSSACSTSTASSPASASA